MPGWFVATFFLGLVLSIGSIAWRVSESRRLARKAGLDEDSAAAAALISEKGFETTYLAAALRSGNQLFGEDSGFSVDGRLTKLEELRQQGLITEDEYAAQRAAIISSI